MSKFLQTTFINVFYGKKIIVFWWEMHWNLFNLGKSNIDSDDDVVLDKVW